MQVDCKVNKVYVRHFNAHIQTAQTAPISLESGLPVPPMPELMRHNLGIESGCTCQACAPDRDHVWWERDKFAKGQLKKVRDLPLFITQIADCQHDALHIAQDEPSVVGESLCQAVLRQAHLESQLILTRQRIITRRGDTVPPESPKRTVKSLDQLEEEQDRFSERLGLCIRTVGDLLAPQYYVVEDGGVVIYTCTRQLPEETPVDQS